MVNLLLIESPGKVRKLSQILGSGWIVKASVGHVRELANDGEDSLGFDLGDGSGNSSVDCRYVPRSPRAKKVLSELRQAVKQADAVYIATDPDREGETIGWHLQQALRLKNPRRVVYSEITPAAVRAAIAQPRQLDPSLVAAGRARDCLDKLVGYRGSRYVVWPLRNGAKSMGRVQSATLHLICEREREIAAFVPEDYWSVWVNYAEGLKAFYRRSPEAKPKRTRTADAGAEDAADPADRPGKQQTKNQNKTQPAESDRIRTQAEADQLIELAHHSNHRVHSVEGTTKHQSPPPPFITSTLQQAAGSKLRLSPERTMKLAQSLYEAGHITYMRTDSVDLAAPFKAAVKQYLQQHDPTNLPQRSPRHRVAKGAQAAHEAIRPTKVEQTPEVMTQRLSGDEAKLYGLIWNRAIASQCSPARLRKTRIVTYCQRVPGSGSGSGSGQQPDEAYWEARGQVVEFAGYSRYWNNLSADAQLPALQPRQSLQLRQAKAEQKQTQPPLRYSEPKLIQLMERKGIGRPSTYAPTLKTLRDRTYACLQKGKLLPTPLGLSLDEALGQLLPELIQPKFTAQMEAQLDAIATSPDGERAWQLYLTQWNREYFAPAIAQAQKKMGEVLTTLSSPAPAVFQDLGGQKSEGQRFETQKPSGQRAKVGGQNSRGPKSVGRKSVGRKSAASKSGAQRSTPKRSRKPSADSGRTPQVTCVRCGAAMEKIPSKSKKLQTNHFLRCSAPACSSVMFWNAGQKKYEPPRAQRTPDPASFTDYPCPVCGALMERHSYKKAGQSKVMLRCSVLEQRRGKCKEVAYFQGYSGFWSPKFGPLQLSSAHQSAQNV